jgi:hypothetical protein
MSLHLQIVNDCSGGWSVYGLPGQAVAQLASLAASFEHARKECGEVAATIELIVEGTCAVIHQERGWPRHPVDPAGADLLVEETSACDRSPPRISIRARLKKWGGAA